MKHTHLASMTPLEISSSTARRVNACLRRQLSIALVCLWWCLLVSSVLAQNVKHTQNNTDSALRSDFRVDPTTLGLGFQLTISNYPGRAGTSLPITLSYSSKLWRMNAKDTYGAPYSAIGKTRTEAKYAEYSAAGWTTNFDLPRLEGLEWLPYDYTGAGICILPSCVQENSESATFYVYRMMVHMPDGSAHELRRDDTPVTTHTSGGVYYAVDGSRMRYDAEADVLYLPDGSRYLNPGNIANGVQYLDRNGNTLNYNTSAKQWTDTLGRVISRPPLDSTLTGDFSYTVKGAGGADLIYTLRWRYLSDVRTDATQPLRYAGDRTMSLPQQPRLSPSLFDSTAEEVACTASGQVFNPIVLYQIVLPNGRSYTFTYNVWGEIDKVVYPTGAYERYRYDKIGGISDSYYENDVYRQTNRGVVERWMSVTGDGTDETQHRWQYSAGNHQETTPYTVTITAPDGSRTERLLKGPQNESRFGFEHVLNAKAYEERAYSAAGQMLRRTLTEWTQTGPLPGGEWSATRDARATKQIEILLDASGQALSATTTFEYDSDLNVTATHRYGYVSVDQSTAQTGASSAFALGTLLRTEETTYLVNDPTIDATTRVAYRTRNLLSLPTSTRVKDGAGAIVAQTAISYDEAAYPVLTYSNVTNWTDPLTTVRGLVTTQSAWLSTSNTWLQSHIQYDQFGNVRKTWDAKGNLSQVEYSSSYNYAYPTHTISPTPDIGNSFCSTTPLETTTVYDFSTGLVTSSTDANGKTTTMQYNDVLNRPTAVFWPDGGRMTYTYVDTHQCGSYVETRTLLDTSGRETDDYVFFDGLGRNVRAFKYDGQDPSNLYLTSDTQYDSLGRVIQVSNPYRSPGCTSAINPSGRWTTTSYDALSRVLTVTTPDSAVVSTTYSGNQVTVTDQAGKSRSSVTDALGTLTQVIEDPNGLAYQTTYTYDVLGNLSTVTQGTQHRYFMYDSLSRLIRAKNPEQDANASLALSDPLSGNSQWSMAYAYDNNGNLSSRTDARGITATYVYDNLNRNTTVNYTDGTHIDRTYDTATNGRGRLRASYYYPTSGANSQTAIDAYDSMGRPLSQRQHFYANGSWGTAYTTQRTYDLAGHVLSQTYPSGRTVNYTFDQMGRTQSFIGNLGDGVTRTYSSSISYNEWNNLSREQFGTDTPLYHKSFSNIRGQLFDTRLSSVNDMWDWNRGRLTYYYSSNHQWGQSGTDNNGNVLSVENWIPPPNATLDQAESLTEDKYTYDSLNRINDVKEQRMTAAGGWGVWAQQFAQSYAYDRWGNRTINGGGQTWGTGINSQQFTVDANHNRLGVPTGQSGVMQYDQAGSLTNDTYSGMGSRAYDAENRMTSATNNASQQSVYTYDGDGRRVRRQSYNQEVWQVYGMDGELLAEYAANSAASTPQKEYGYRNGELLITAQPVSQPYNGTPFTIPGIIETEYYDQGGEGIAYHDTTPGTHGQDYTQAGNPPTAFRSPTDVDIYKHSSYSNNYIVLSQAGDWMKYTVNVATSGTYTLEAQVIWGWINGTPGTFHIEMDGVDKTGPIQLPDTNWANQVITKSGVQLTAGQHVMKVVADTNAGNGYLGDLDYLRFTTAMPSTPCPDTPSALPGSIEAECFNNGGEGVAYHDTTAGTHGQDYTQAGNPPTTFRSPTDVDIYKHSSYSNSYIVLSQSGDWMQYTVEVSTTGSYTLQAQVAWGGTNGTPGTFHVEMDGVNVTGQMQIPDTNWALTTITKSGVQLSAGQHVMRVVADSNSGNGYTGDFDYFSLVLDAAGGGGATAATTIQWMVTDQLGTPRIEVDQTGTLAGVKRHDYLPFGEELQVGSGGRSAQQGYVGDDVRQKFTSYERDIETGLDYAQARYYASSQGRFTSVDPLMASARSINPQTWNRYSYAFNNPLRFTDPSGMIAGDFYDEGGKRLGTDGLNDGKIYIVSDDATAKQIKATDKQGGTTAVSSVSSAVELPSLAVRQEIGAAVERSNSPTTDDTKGGFHEEGGVWGTVNGAEKIVPAAAGPYSNPQVNSEASIDVFKPANAADAGGVTTANAQGTYHIHPKGKIEVTTGPESKPGVTVIGGSTSTTTYSFAQPPSPRDISNASSRGIGTNVVVGAGDKKAYIYNGSGVRVTMKLDTFLKIGRK